MEERAARGAETIDLTETNPTRVGLAYPGEEPSRSFFAGALRLDIQPHPRGLLEAREALAAHLSTPGDPVSPEDLVLTASTSESYSLLFKLFGDPGDEVLTAAPSYPLLDSLAALESLSLRHFYLEPGRGFALDVERAELAITERTRLVALIHPGNPTGAFLSAREQAAVLGLCASRDLPLISDEVFFDFGLADDPLRAGPAAASGEALAFSLGGLSKSAGLPSWKLGMDPRGRSRRSPPSGPRGSGDGGGQLSFGLGAGPAGPPGSARPRAPHPGGDPRPGARQSRHAPSGAGGRARGRGLLEPQGGWAAVLRVSLPASDEELALEILERAGVLVHPGYFFDFLTDDFLVLSLLPEPERFAEGVRRMARLLGPSPPDRERGAGE